MNRSVLHPGKWRWKPKIVQSKRKILNHPPPWLWRIKMSIFQVVDVCFFWCCLKFSEASAFFQWATNGCPPRIVSFSEARPLSHIWFPRRRGDPGGTRPLISGAKILGGQSASKKKPRFGLAPQAVGANEGEMSERGENAMFFGKKTRSKNCRSVWVKSQGLHRICCKCCVASRNGFEHGSW